MIRSFLVPAVLTGAFCAVFAVGIDFATDMLRTGSIIVFAFVSGFLGSIFARLVLGERRKD